MSRVVPNGKYKVGEESFLNRQRLSRIVEATRPHTVVHGHYHYPYETTHPTGARVIGLNRDEYARQHFVMDTEDLRAS